MRIPEPGEHAVLVLRLRGTGRVGGPVQIARATPVLGESTYAAYLDAAAWLTGDVQQASEDGDRGDQRSGSGGKAQRGHHAPE